MKFSYRIYFESILFRCSDGFNFNLYKRHLEETVNSQGREQMHSLLEKCTQSLRLLSYRHFMIFLRVFFAMTNLQIVSRNVLNLAMYNFSRACIMFGTKTELANYFQLSCPGHCW